MLITFLSVDIKSLLYGRCICQLFSKLSPDNIQRLENEKKEEKKRKTYWCIMRNKIFFDNLIFFFSLEFDEFISILFPLNIHSIPFRVHLIYDFEVFHYFLKFVINKVKALIRNTLFSFIKILIINTETFAHFIPNHHYSDK